MRSRAGEFPPPGCEPVLWVMSLDDRHPRCFHKNGSNNIMYLIHQRQIVTLSWCCGSLGAMEFLQRAIGYCGVGINISRETPFTVQLLHEGRSAHRSGLIKPGDVIVSIAGESLQVVAAPLSPRHQTLLCDHAASQIS